MLGRATVDRSATALGALLLALLAMLASPAGAWAADPFYEKMLADGKRALTEGRIDEATLDLEIACFGLLDEPTLLGQGLAHLAVAQSRARDTSTVKETIERLLEVERLYQGYSLAEIPEPISSDVERILLDSVSPDRLAEIDSLRSLSERRSLDDLTDERPERRRQILTERLSADPDDDRALQLLAELEIEQGNPAAALPYLDMLVERSGGEASAVCRRFRVAAEAGSCAVDLDAIETCPEDAKDSTAAPEVLSCLMEAPDPVRATAFLESLDPQIRSLPKVRKLEKRLDRRLARIERATADPNAADANAAIVADGTGAEIEPAADAGVGDQVSAGGGPELTSSEPTTPEATTPEATTPEPTTPEPTAPEPTEDELRAVRRRLDRARTAADLTASLAAALELADTYPQSRQAQFLGAEAAYRAAQWDQAVRLFDAAGDPDNSQPLLLFYKAVSLFESGSTSEAADCLERALPYIRKTDFVERYAQRILAAAAGEG